MMFNQSSNRLYNYDINKNSITIVTTVEKRMEKDTKKSIEQAKLARNIQQAIGYPSTTEFIKIIERGDIKECPVNKADMNVTEDIFGPDVGSLKGKTVRRKIGYVKDASPFVLPPNIINNYKQISLCADSMFINKITFLMTISRHSTCEALISQSHYNISNALQNS